MSSTRRASKDAPISQERYSSSTAYEPGLLGNLVARRAKAIRKPGDRALVYWLQAQSHLDGGLQSFAEKFVAAFPERIGTPAMRRVGKVAGQTYTEAEQALVKEELPTAKEDSWLFFDGPTPNSLSQPFAYNASDFLGDADAGDSYNPSALNEQVEPSSVDNEEEAQPVQLLSVSECINQCLNELEELPDLLKRICLDPKVNLEERDCDASSKYASRYSESSPSVWWFQDLVGALHEYRLRSIQAAADSIASTSISRKIFDDLDYCLYIRHLVIIEGEQRTGKSTAAKAWCDMHPGQAIYVRLESGIDEATFFRAISRAVGTASSIQRKAHEMRMRVQDMLQEGHLILVVDEAQFLWGQTIQPRSAPARVDWMRTALLDYGVGVAWICTPQFDRQCALYEKRLAWNAKQIKGRVKLHTHLPTELPAEDLEAVARKMAPQADEISIERLVGFAEGSDDYLAGIERLSCRASFFAARDGREVASAADIKRALDEALPALQAPDPAPVATRKKAPRKARALPLQDRCTGRSDTFPAPTSRRASMDLPASSEAGFGASERLQFTEAAASE